MRTEIKKTLKKGFVLNEQELRRLLATIKEQLKTAYPASDTKIFFEVKFKNGSIAMPTTVDEILAQENRGSEAIVSLKVREVSAQDETCQIEIKFSSEESGDNDKPITYQISHDDKDWVFVTNSKIDERLSRIKRIPIASLITSRNAFPVAFMVGFLSVATFVFPNSSSRVGQSVDAVRALERHYLQIKNPSVIQYIADIQVSLLQHNAQGAADLFPLYLMLAMIFVLAGLFALGKMVDYLFPAYNFIWGDYVDVYQRKKNLSYGIFVLVILSIVISVVANVISGKLLHIV